MHAPARVLIASLRWATLIIFASLVFPSSCFAKLISITIDWVPTPEYYGFFYAKEKGIYEGQGLTVKINTASGAPLVATQLATGQIYLGTTTSDGILRRLKDGAVYTYLVPLARYNPVSLVSLATQPIESLHDIRGKVIGVNPQAGPYSQFIYLLNRDNIPRQSFREYPIGFGGAVQLQSGEVQAFLAYTTNQAVDLEVASRNIYELYFDTLGIKTYGLVLAVAKDSIFLSAGLTNDDIRQFIKATLTGYKLGGDDVDGAVESLIRAEPTLNPNKLTAAIRKMHRLNSAASTSVPNDLDAWVAPDQINDNIRSTQRSLLIKGFEFIRDVSPESQTNKK